MEHFGKSGLPVNAYTELKPGEQYVPIVPADAGVKEISFRSIFVGIIMTILFSGAAAFLGLKIAQVFEAAIPIAILAVGIGTALVRRLRAFDMKLLGIRRHDPLRAREELGLDWSGGPEELHELLRNSDYVVLCVPHSGVTDRMMNAGTFSSMKKGAFLINLARGGLVDRQALEEALRTGMIAGAGLDVFWEEPPDPADPIFAYNVLATPHIAGSTDVSMQGIVSAVAGNIERTARGETPLFLKLPG